MITELSRRRRHDGRNQARICPCQPCHKHTYTRPSLACSLLIAAHSLPSLECVDVMCPESCGSKPPRQQRTASRGGAGRTIAVAFACCDDVTQPRRGRRDLM